MRAPLPPGSGSTYGRSSREVWNDVEVQPFNWPKSCWGGDLRVTIENAAPQERVRLYSQLGGTTTARRTDWDEIASAGLAHGWYVKRYGQVRSILPTGSGPSRRIELNIENAAGETENFQADYIIDCTGLIGELSASPFLSDLIQTYELKRNPRLDNDGSVKPSAGLSVSNSFEIPSLRSANGGKMYAAGTITQNGPYAAVDSFLGLQYAALRSVDDLSENGAPHVGRFGPVQSFAQWIRWCTGSPPDHQ